MSEKELIDTQAQDDPRGVFIPKVGISDYEAPVRVLRKDGSTTETVATFSLYGSLAAATKGTNMSRFSIVITKAIQNNPIGIDFMNEVLDVMQKRVECDDIYIKIRFPFFEEKLAPVSKIMSYVKRDVTFEGKLLGDKKELLLTVEANYMSLCACSKNMSLVDEEQGIGKGAHNQRSLGTIKIQLPEDKIIWIEDLAAIIDQEGSCAIVNSLKREDEKYVTEYSYENPKFVEDFVRDVALRVQSLGVPFVVTGLNYESIHQSNAVGVVRGGLE